MVKIKRVSENEWEKNTLMSVSYASLVTENVDPNARVSLPHLNPHSLQELCRFKIRQSIREAIEAQDENYYKIKRHLSTYNTNREKKKSETSDSENNSAENEDDDEENNSIVGRLARISESRLRDNELRLMIYGHLMDPDGTFSLNLTREDNENPSPALVLLRPSRTNEENRTEESEDHEDQETSADSGVSDGSQLSSQSSSLTEPSKVVEENADSNQKPKKPRRDSTAERHENLLRSRIMQLPLSINVKNFLLYYREI